MNERTASRYLVSGGCPLVVTPASTLTPSGGLEAGDADAACVAFFPAAGAHVSFSPRAVHGGLVQADPGARVNSPAASGRGLDATLFTSGVDEGMK